MFVRTALPEANCCYIAAFLCPLLKITFYHSSPFFTFCHPNQNTGPKNWLGSLVLSWTGFPEDSLGKIPHFLCCALNERGCSASLSQIWPPLALCIYFKKLITTANFFLRKKNPKQNKTNPPKTTPKHLLSNNWETQEPHPKMLRGAKLCPTQRVKKNKC